MSGRQSLNEHRNKASLEPLHSTASMEHATVQNYQPPAVSQSTLIGHNINNASAPPMPPPKAIDYVYNPSDGSVLLDHNGRPISVDKLLATKPLRGELSTRPGPGNKKLTYISGDGISRTLNDIFGFDGWNLDITSVDRVETMQNQGKYTVVYTARVRLTHKASGAYKEDCGAGDATDRSFAIAVGHALKQSITDAMKRAARHFGDKLGNSLYSGNFSVKTAPTTLKSALDKYDIERANAKFGFAKDQAYNNNNNNSQNLPPTNTTAAKNPMAAPAPGHSSNGTFSASRNDTPGAPLTNKIIHESANSVILTARPLQQQQAGIPAKTTTAAPTESTRPQQPIPPTTSRHGISKASNTSAHSNSMPVQQPQHRAGTLSNAIQHGPPVLPPANNPTSQIGPPPTPTDALRNSVLFSEQHHRTSHSSAAGILMPGDGKATAISYSSNSRHYNPPTPVSTTTAMHGYHNTSQSRPNARSRLSIGQTPIQLAPMVTPSSMTPASNANGKRLHDSSLNPMDGHNKRQRNVNNPYMAA